jgi:DNA-binding PadR family transcriptional regulator
VLRLLVEQPSYGYELSRHYRARFGRWHPMALARTYEVLDALRERGLIAPVALKVTTKQSARRLGFGATASGVNAYYGWVTSSAARIE